MNERRLASVELFALVVVGGVLASIVAPFIRYNRADRLAQYYAEKRYGDHVAPLTSQEREEWYQELRIPPGQEPSVEQKEHFWRACENNVLF